MTIDPLKSASAHSLLELAETPTMKLLRQVEEQRRPLDQLLEATNPRDLRVLQTDLEKVALLDRELASGIQALKWFENNELPKIQRIALEAHDTMRLFVNSPGWSRIVEQIEAVGRAMQEPAFVRSMTAFHDQVQALALVIPPAIAPAAETIALLAEQTARAIAPFAEASEAREWQVTLEARMGLAQGPWAFEAEMGLSAAGFARLARISDATHSEEPYHGSVNELLAEELGSGAGDGDGDPTTRDASAMEAGLQPELISFPPPQYASVIVATGFRFVFEGVPAPQPVEGGCADTVYDPAHHVAIEQVEQRLRILISSSLGAIEGAQWVKRRVPDAMCRRWKDRQEEDRAAGRPVFELIQYADFIDLADLISQKNNWNEAFQPIFRHRDEVQVSLRRLHPVRKALAHSRGIGRADALTLVGEATRILTALGVQMQR